MNISGLNKAKVLQALYARARVQGLGILHAEPSGLSDEDATSMVENNDYFDYVRGRVMKVGLGGDDLNPALYDRDNGDGAAAAALKEVFPDHSF